MPEKPMPKRKGKQSLTDKEFSLLLQKILEQQVTIQPITWADRNKLQHHRNTKYFGFHPSVRRNVRVHTNYSFEHAAVYYIRAIPIESSSRKIIALTKEQYEKCLHVYNSVIQRPPQIPKPISGGSSEGNKEGGNKK